MYSQIMRYVHADSQPDLGIPTLRGAHFSPTLMILACAHILPRQETFAMGVYCSWLSASPSDPYCAVRQTMLALWFIRRFKSNHLCRVSSISRDHNADRQRGLNHPQVHVVFEFQTRPISPNLTDSDALQCLRAPVSTA